MILKQISKEQAFKLLLNKETANKVLVKAEKGSDYRRAKDHRYAFGFGSMSIDFREADFYIEEEEKETSHD